MNITNYPLLRAVSLCRAPKTDLRYYLRGILFEFAEGRATASDGYRLMTAVVATPEPGVEPFLWTPDGALPTARDLHATLNFDTGVLQVGTRLCVGSIEVPNLFPDWRRVVASDKVGTGDYSLAFNPALVADVAKALGSMMIRFTWPEKDAPLDVRFQGLDADYQFALMPGRW